MSSSNATSLANPTPYQLRSLVLDYLCHSCYTRTASAFNKDSTVRQLDADGDEIIPDVSGDGSVQGSRSDESFQSLLQQVRLREEIRMHIMCGRVDDATDLLNTHFPAVLSQDIASATEQSSELRPTTSTVEYISSTSTEPAHLYLNLRILAFSEACRTVPLEYPPRSKAPKSDLSDSMSIVPAEDAPELPAPADNPEHQLDLLNRAQKLYAFTNTLTNNADRATYLKELENVGGLLAYKTPETSSMSKYLTLERREAVADQINRAILKRTGQPLVSSLELVTRCTQVVWQLAREHGVKARPGAIIPPRGSRASSGEETDAYVVPTFDLHHFLDARP